MVVPDCQSVLFFLTINTLVIGRLKKIYVNSHFKYNFSYLELTAMFHCVGDLNLPE